MKNISKLKNSTESAVKCGSRLVACRTEDAVELVAEVDAVIAERDQLRAEVEALRGQAHALHLVGHALGLPAGSDLTREVLPAIEALRKGTARYEAVRKLDPRQFAELWGACLSGDRLFDDSVDDLIDAAMAAKNGAQ